MTKLGKASSFVNFANNKFSILPDVIDSKINGETFTIAVTIADGRLGMTTYSCNLVILCKYSKKATNEEKMEETA